MKTLSYIIDIGSFCIMLFMFDINFIIALILSTLLGWSVRLLFLRSA